MTRLTYPEPADRTTAAVQVDGRLVPFWRDDTAAVRWTPTEPDQRWFHDPGEPPRNWSQVLAGATALFALARVTDDGGMVPGPDIHEHFELTFGAYLVLHRTLLQAMPDHWQRHMTALLREYDDAFEHLRKAPVYQVVPAEQREVRELDAIDLQRIGITATRDEPDGDDDELRYHNADGIPLDPRLRVYVPLPDGDPIPQRTEGRTVTVPQLRRPGRAVGDPGE